MMLSCLTALWVGEAFARAAEPKPRDNEAIQKVVSEALDAVKAAQWQKFAGLMHPDALRDLKQTFAPALEAADADSDELRQVMRFFGKPKDVKELLALPPDKFFARFLEGTMESVPRLRKVLSGSEFQMIGTVYEKDGTAHVVYRGRIKVNEVTVSKVDVISLKQDGESWRMLLSGDFKALADQLRGALKK
jgi:hypothetical protein